MIFLVSALSVLGFASDNKPASSKEQREYIKRCPLKLEGKWHSTTVSRLLPGEHYRQHPVVSYNIEEDGRVTNVQLVQSSGVPRIDKDFVEQTALNHYKKRLPGCGVIETKMDLTIDWY
jgi:hypothetical protein